MMSAVAVPRVSDPSHPRFDRPESQLARLREIIRHAGRHLPAQGPITVFIHHNTLHAFEAMPFEDGVQRGASLFGCEPFLAEDRYRLELARGRIRGSDIAVVLRDDLGVAADDPVAHLGSLYELRMAMLRHPLSVAATAELRWFVAETDALTRIRPDVPNEVRQRLIGETRHWVMRDLRGGAKRSVSSARDRAGHKDRPEPDLLASLFDRFGRASIERWSLATWEAFCLQALYRICWQGVNGAAIRSSAPARRVRHRDLLLAATGEDSDPLVHDLLIRLCAAFLDQGLTHWPLPLRERGLYRAFLALYRRGGGPPSRWLHGLAAELGRLEDRGVGAQESVLESLELLGVADAEWEDFLLATLLALRGWGGMILQAETRTDRVVHAAPPGSLIDFLAVRLILERFAVAHLARNALGYEGPLDRLRRTLEAAGALPETGVKQRAFLVFQLAQVRGWPPGELQRLSPVEWAGLVTEIEAFSEVHRRRLFQLAYERAYRIQTLDALAAHASGEAPERPAPAWQVVCCIDEREESFRRHLEEIAPDVETFGAAGFFGMAMYFRGAGDAHFVPLCPVAISPRHWVTEEVVDTSSDRRTRRIQRRRTWGAAWHAVHVGSRSFTLGALLSAGFGVLASIPLVAQVLFPRAAARLRRKVRGLIEPPADTSLRLERIEASPGPEGGHVGLTLDEMAAVVERLLSDMGLTGRLARLVLLLGHGSSSLNNPHESAYNCGACGGSRGGPNARVLAHLANDPRVRQLLAAKGVSLPSETVFIGGYHNTCDDSLTLFDLDRLPESHRAELAQARERLDLARARNAQERCRRFESAPLNVSPAAALEHVEARAQDLAQTRPEYNHATNAICIVGRRGRTRGLFLDRRSFLVSYDPTQDDERRQVLSRILQAILPVCAGINLEYYFSTVDPAGWGCGTKLPHNITSLLGVMDGAASDLRTGLAAQMVEIHEPVRLLVVVETTPTALQQIMDSDRSIARMCHNDWVQLATLSPYGPEIHVYHQERFQRYTPESGTLPRAASSVDWFRGWRENLDFAQIDG
jgi:uncharacterized protein YbcC (UPF0753/DUF2309 family)